MVSVKRTFRKLSRTLRRGDKASAANAVYNKQYELFHRFAPPGHYYSPIPSRFDIENRAQANRESGSRALPGIDLNEQAQVDLAKAFARFYAEMPFPDLETTRSRYYLENNFFRRCDVIALYSMLRWARPRQIIEVGSGFSSAAMLDVNDAFFQGSIKFTFIDPHPERLLSLLNEQDRQQSRILRARVQDVGVEAFASLGNNDILFIDSSHVAKTNSDVLHLLFTVLPGLAPGVIIHVHDILWPFEYPKAWFDQGRAWNEAYIMRAFLQYNRTFEILYFNSFMVAHHAALLADTMPGMLAPQPSPARPGNSSLWLRKVA